MEKPTSGLISDSARDAKRYHNLLLALSTAIEAIQSIERSTPSIDLLLLRLMPVLAEALNAGHAFVTLLRDDQQTGERYFEFTAAWPRAELIGQRLTPSTVFDDVARSGKIRVVDPLGELARPLIPGLEILDAGSAMLVRMQTASQTRIVGICTERHAVSSPYLTVDEMALQSIVELIALGARAGERRRRELDGIQETSAALLTVLDLQGVLSIIVARAAQVFDVPATSVMLWDRMKTSMVIGDSWGLPQLYKETHRLSGDRAKTLAESTDHFHPLTADVLQSHPIGDEPLIEQHGLFEVLCAPLTMTGQLIGYLSIYDRDAHRSVTPEEIELIEIFAGQAALAVHRAELYEAIKRRNQHWQALHEASKSIAEGFAGDRKKVLDKIVEQAIESISGIHGPKANFGVIQLYDSTAEELTFETVYPPEELSHLERQLGYRRSISRSADSSLRIGITGRTVLTKTAQRIDSVSSDGDYLVFNPATQSELSVPLMDNDGVVGVLSLESNELAAFDMDDEKALSGLADMAVIVMKNQEQTDQLNRAHAVALMGAWSADVAHDTIREIGVIRRTNYLIGRHDGLSAEVRSRLREIDQAAEALFALQQLPPAPDLSAPGSGQSGAQLDYIVCQEVDALRKKYETIQWRCEPSCAGLWVNMHDQWLRRVLRHLAHNAAAAVSQKPTQAIRCVTLRTVAQNDMAEVQIEDTGTGVPHALWSSLFKKPVLHANGSQGRGLLLVRFILEQYGGEAKLAWSQQGEGSCFVFRVPCEPLSP